MTNNVQIYKTCSGIVVLPDHVNAESVIGQCAHCTSRYRNGMSPEIAKIIEEETKGMDVEEKSQIIAEIAEVLGDTKLATENDPYEGVPEQTRITLGVPPKNKTTKEGLVRNWIREHRNQKKY